MRKSTYSVDSDICWPRLLYCMWADPPLAMRHRAMTMPHKGGPQTDPLSMRVRHF